MCCCGLGTSGLHLGLQSMHAWCTCSWLYGHNVCSCALWLSFTTACFQEVKGMQDAFFCPLTASLSRQQATKQQQQIKLCTPKAVCLAGLLSQQLWPAGAYLCWFAGDRHVRCGPDPHHGTLLDGAAQRTPVQQAVHTPSHKQYTHHHTSSTHTITQGVHATSNQQYTQERLLV
jgi:hypothetical protein